MDKKHKREVNGVYMRKMDKFEYRGKSNGSAEVRVNGGVVRCKGVRFEHEAGESPVLTLELVHPISELEGAALVEYQDIVEDVRKRMCRGYCKYYEEDTSTAECRKCPIWELA